MKPYLFLLHALVGVLLFTTMASAQITGLCNTGQASATASGCTGVLVPPNPNAWGTPYFDGNWEVGFPWPSKLAAGNSPCLQKIFVPTTVDTPFSTWLANSASAASEWAMPDGGGYLVPRGYYIYRTKFPVPSVLPGGGVPTGLTINGQLASDNITYSIYLESPANSTAACAVVSGQTFPVNTPGGPTFQQWWPFSFSNALPLSAGTDAYLYIIVGNGTGTNNSSPSGLRVEFSSSSGFH
jgi:hypothetical protein